ncbi:hypothetical protein FHW94_003945 [Novosphingobium sp. SG720]|nr:hypothetical protein [Novosphingobium sp. SG720]
MAPAKASAESERECMYEPFEDILKADTHAMPRSLAAAPKNV